MWDRERANFEGVTEVMLARGVIRTEQESLAEAGQILGEAMELASKVALLDRGKLVHFGERTEAMLQDAGYLYRTLFIIDCGNLRKRYLLTIW